MALNDPPAPGIRTGITQRTEDAFHHRGFVDAWPKREFHWVESNRIAACQIGFAIHEPPKRESAAARRKLEARGSHRLGCAGQGNIDEASGGGGPRSHCSIFRYYGAHGQARAPAQASCPLRPC